MIHRENRSARAFAQGLGWFSLGLGAAELLAAGQLARTLGLEDRTDLIRAYGAREVATGLGILLAEDPTPWVWGRVAGDVLDLATIAGGLDGDNPRRANVGIAVAAITGALVADLLCARELAAEGARQVQHLPPPDYSGRSGLPRPPEAMRGAARDFEVPPDMRIPEALRPYAAAPA